MRKVIEKLKRWWFYRTTRCQLRNRNVTIISENCWGGILCQYLGIGYNSPFVGLLVPAPDYIKILRSLKEYVEGDFRFIPRSESRYERELRYFKNDFPIAELTPKGGGDVVEIHFLHYKSPEEAVEKWRRRAQRINYDNIIVKLAERNECTAKEIAEFDALDYPSKICFTAKEYPFRSTRVLDALDFIKRGRVNWEWRHCHKCYNFVEEANRLLDAVQMHRRAVKA
jgi:uncharacterized protein (DUF1919 family)